MTVMNARGAFRINGADGVPGTLAVQRDIVWVASLGLRADKGWSFRDRAGHFHAYSTGETRYPTLWEGYITCDSPHLDGDAWWCDCRTEYTCRICKAVVTPGMAAGPHQEAHPGAISWNVVLDLETLSMPQWEVGMMVTVEAVLPDATRFGIAVVTSVSVKQFGDLINVKTVLQGAGALGELGKR